MHPREIFLRYLKQLSRFIDRVEAHENGSPDILNARLSDGMFPFSVQVRVAANFSLRACCPLVNSKVVAFDNDNHSFSGLREQINETVAHLESLAVNVVDQLDARITDKAGFTDLSLPASEYVNLFALPNFFFHISMAYAIARSRGLPVSKGDYDGYHNYPADFSFG